MRSKAGKELPDLGIHPPLGLVHLGTGRGKTEERSREDRKDAMRLCPPPRPRQARPAPAPILSAHSADTWCLVLGPIALSLLDLVVLSWNRSR